MRSALKSVEGIADIETNVSDNTCTFKAPADLNVKATLDKFVEDGNSKIKDWSLNVKKDDAQDDDDGEDDADDDGKTQTVSLKLPGMT